MKKARLQLLLGILIVIALLHLAAIYFIAGGGGGEGGAAGTAVSGEENTVETAKNKTPAGQNGALSHPAVPAEPGINKLPPAPKICYRKASNRKNFGAALDYSSARRGTLSNIPLTKQAKAGILVDMDSRKVLWAKNEKQALPIASMTKMMTMLIAFEEAERRQVPLGTEIAVSAAAAKVPPSGIGLKTGEKLPLSDLMKASTIRSANDAAYLIGEYFGDGDVKSFIRRMNVRATELGLKGASFHSPNGLPGNPDSVATAENMILLAERLQEYPNYMKWASTSADYVREGKTLITNTNHLVRPRYPGVDGMKTGYTRNAGYCVTVSCEREGRRLMLCLMGLDQAKTERDPLARQLLDWGYGGKRPSAAGKTQSKKP